ncbi:hypothetical protein DEU56DRAFT_906183 [Suillus clintonianus]|uniref:uncharacterized protein n=1 Tax=Suillus clintonianus TaxID=1904413 RepID=UPI001B87DE89|nr:uncharacterized protein DEU56DRAFT_906183 [Suillus clintonianus]KAG2157549.1 hypothetical protein DEU56DRAFT_906183 [Suillus clintonianus]
MVLRTRDTLLQHGVSESSQPHVNVQAAVLAAAIIQQVPNDVSSDSTLNSACNSINSIGTSESPIHSLTVPPFYYQRHLSSSCQDQPYSGNIRVEVDTSSESDSEKLVRPNISRQTASGQQRAPARIDNRLQHGHIVSSTTNQQQQRADPLPCRINVDHIRLQHAQTNKPCIDPGPSDVANNVTNRHRQHVPTINQHRERAPVVDLANQPHQNARLPALQRQPSSETIASVTTTGSGVVEKFYSVRRGWCTGVFTSRLAAVMFACGATGGNYKSFRSKRAAVDDYRLNKGRA